MIQTEHMRKRSLIGVVF